MKAILLVRVSTKAQDFDEQEREIYNMAIKDGYLPECIINWIELIFLRPCTDRESKEQ